MIEHIAIAILAAMLVQLDRAVGRLTRRRECAQNRREMFTRVVDGTEPETRR